MFFLLCFDFLTAYTAVLTSQQTSTLVPTSSVLPTSTLVPTPYNGEMNITDDVNLYTLI